MPDSEEHPVEPPPPKLPVVFISYSHDSREHKAWVGLIAQQLVEKGVDVLFDQWDLGPGDDVPKFMEQAVARADRVLMICSEAYVRKADDGKGGVGYEAMVVTGELVRDLGTNKFIPIVRQLNSPRSLPRCVGTRLYVDLSEGEELEGNFETLLREIHNQPKFSKPALGRNPFSVGQFEGQNKTIAKIERRLDFSSSLENPETAYLKASEIIYADDRIAWRKLLLASAEKAAEGLNKWRDSNSPIPEIKTNLDTARFPHVKAGLDSFAPFIACLLAAAESGKEGYADQLGWVESVLTPTGYNRSGSVYFLAIPQLIFFVTQALVGGMLMVSGSGEAAYQLVVTKINDELNALEAKPLFAMTRVNGWVDTLEHCCTVTWEFLNFVITSWTWLKTVFGSEKECRIAISAYYQMMSFLNFVSLTASGKIDVEYRFTGVFPVSVPLCFCVGTRPDIEKAYQLFLKQRAIILRTLEANDINQEKLEAAWPAWKAKIHSWLGEVYIGRWPEMHVPQDDLPAHLKGNSYKLA